jgi:hypothetical protein
LRPEEKLSDPWDQVRDLLEEYAEAASVSLGNTNLPST